MSLPPKTVRPAIPLEPQALPFHANWSILEFDEYEERIKDWTLETWLLSRGEFRADLPQSLRKPLPAVLIEYARDVPTVRETCRVTGASDRTLEHGFREVFGVTPKAYLQAVRLNGARKDLRASEPHVTKVADIANTWGFWHMGQFAADYHRMFGERPSQTLHA